MIVFIPLMSPFHIFRTRFSHCVVVTIMMLSLVAGIGTSVAQAQIIIGQTAGITGVEAASVGEAIAGADLLFNAVNAKGGIHGEKIQVLRLDDGFDAERAQKNAHQLIAKHNVLALFMSSGTRPTLGLLPLLEQYEVPLLAPMTGATALHRPLRRYVFNVRAPYLYEAKKVLQHIHTIGIQNAAVVYSKATFGAEALQGIRTALKGDPLLTHTLLMDADDQPLDTAIIPKLAQAKIVVWMESSTKVAQGVQALRKAGSQAFILTLSNTASNGFMDLLGDVGNGVVVMQVFPSVRSIDLPLVKEAFELAHQKALGDTELSPAMLEGFAAAKVLVEALHRAGPKPTRARLHAALEGLNNYNLGGPRLDIHYSPDNHSGLSYVDSSVIHDGKFRR